MLLKAFCIGGLICVVGQILLDLTKLTPARILVSFVVAGVVLGAVGCYKALVDFAGAGATVPIIGYGYNLAVKTAEAVKSEGWTGIFTGPLSAGSAGITVSVLSALIVSFFTKSKEK